MIDKMIGRGAQRRAGIGNDNLLFGTKMTKIYNSRFTLRGSFTFSRIFAYQLRHNRPYLGYNLEKFKNDS